MFEGQPKGLYALALANTGERFGYYTMLAIFTLFLQAKFGFSAAEAGQFYSIFLAGVYFLPMVGGILADKFGYGKKRLKRIYSAMEDLSESIGAGYVKLTDLQLALAQEADITIGMKEGGEESDG